MKKKLLKTTAVFVALNFLVTALAPTISYALTAGPTAPEYTSFEPIDTTDMVNLATGDFTYNIPLLEVPGPEGGYPLALSYHAGISPEEEASWVGLGWSLNAGAINRMVNVHPDDMKNELVSTYDQWSGGETEIFSLGIGVGLEGAMGIGVGIDFANDTYKGTGTGVNASLSVGLSSDGNSSVGLGISAGMGPYGNGYVGVGLSSGSAGDGVSVSGNIGLSLSFGNGETQLAGSAGGSVSYSKGADAKNNISLLDASISTNSSRPSMSPGGISVNSISDNSTDLTVNSKGFSVPIPIPYTPLTINVGYRKTRYYIDAFDHEKQLGVLYANAQKSSNIDKKISFDSYALKSVHTDDPMFEQDNVFNNGGSLPAYDSYNVLAQGLSGSIQPYLFEAGAITRKIKWNKDENDVEYAANRYWYDYSIKPYGEDKKISFRFMNEFSNSMILNHSSNTTNTLESYKNISYQIGKEQGGYNDILSDFNASTGALAGSKHVEWFTNNDINFALTPDNTDSYPNISTLKGFIPNITNRNSYVSTGIYGSSAPDQIGGFMITNTSGVNYHYAQPVYNFEELQVSSVHTSDQGDSYRRIEKPVPYAYSWLLTGITGPDYVDRGIIGEVDESDWGYWVKFEYGKWTDQYIWRTPNEGTDKDTWSDWKTYGAGKKELYYLNSVITRTHTALFVKELRKDNKGVKDKDSGGFGIESDVEGNIIKCSAPSLKLSRILLFSNRVLSKVMEDSLSINEKDLMGNVKDLITTRDDLRSNSELANPLMKVSGTNVDVFHWESVLTESDIVNLITNKGIKEHAARQIVFNHNYTLCNNTPNHLDIDYETHLIETPTSELQVGKLTLSSIDFLGYSNSIVIPPTNFVYSNPSGYVKDKKDIWGMYKSDANPEYAKTMEQITTVESSELVSAWSLISISNGLGSVVNINYESDKYKKVVVEPYCNLPVSSIVTTENPNEVEITLHSSELLSNIPELNKPNPLIKFMYVLVETKGPYYDEDNNESYTNDTIYKDLYLSQNILLLSGNKVRINNSQMYNDFLNTFVLSSHTTVNGNEFYNLFTTHTLLSMNVILDRDNTAESFGGGLRVASVSLISDNIMNTTNYTYHNGVMAYEPLDLNVNLLNGARINSEDGKIKEYVKDIGKYYYTNIIANSSFLPSPGVWYEEVTVQDEVKDLASNIVIDGLNYSVFRFNTYNATMLPRTEDATVNNLGDNKIVKKVTFRDFRNIIGSLKEITVKKASDNSILKQTTNNYLHDNVVDYNTDYETLLLNNFNNQGRIDQLYFEKKKSVLIPNIQDEVEYLLLTEVEEYPIVHIGQTVRNTKTNITKTSKTLSFDYYTGSPRCTYQSDGMGNHYMDVSIPAYEIGAYDEMGLKVKNHNNKNMLTQSAGAITYVVSSPIVGATEPYTEFDFTKLGVMTATSQKWLKNGVGVVYPVTVPDNKKDYHLQNIWLKGSSYSWIGDESAILRGDGMYPLNSYSTFNYSNGSLNSQWQLQEEITKYDVYSHALEAIDLNQKYSSILMDPLNIQVTASASLASRSEIAYSGAEFNSYIGTNEGDVDFGDGAAVPSNAHTGKNSLVVGSGGNQKGFTFSFLPKAGRKYHASVWVYQPGGVKADGTGTQFMPRLIAINRNTNLPIATGLPSVDQKAAGFYRLSIDISPANSTDLIEVYCLNANPDGDKPQYFDDFRVHPLDASFTSYVYDLDKGWLTYILDGDNFYSRFEYDDNGKLKAVYKELFRINEKLVTKNKYNYGK